MTLKSRLTGLIAIATCCLARLSAQAEYHSFNTASGADGMVQEVRWPVPFPVIASFTLLANGSFNLGGTGAVNHNACKLNCLGWDDFLLGGSILIAGSR